MPHSRNPRRVLSRLAHAGLALAALLVFAGCGGDPTVARSATPTSASKPAPPLNGPHMVATLIGISMVSRDEGWIIGRDGYYDGIGSFLLHYHDGSWSLEDFPALVDKGLATPTSIAMVTADTGWIAVTMAPDNSQVMLHEHAGGWTVDKLPESAGIVTTLSTVSAEDAWALSTSAAPASGAPASAILRYRDGQWVTEASFPGASLTAISMDSASDGWAVGSDSAGPALLHYAAGAWTRVKPSALDGVTAMTGVFMASPSVGWATGVAAPAASNCTECGGIEQQRILLQFRDGSWRQVKENSGGVDELRYTSSSDQQFLPDSVAASADGSGWVARGNLVYIAPDGQQQTFSATCQTDFIGMAPVPSSAGAALEGWVIGSHGQLFHFIGGALTRYDTGAPCDPLS